MLLLTSRRYVLFLRIQRNWMYIIEMIVLWILIIIARREELGACMTGIIVEII